MKSHSQSKRVSKTGIWQLMKYASLSIVLGVVSIIAIRSAGGAGDIEVLAGEGDGEIFGIVDDTLLESTPDWIQNPSVAMNDEGTIITAYDKYDGRLEIIYGLYTRFCKQGVWENPVVIFGYEDTTGIYLSVEHRVTINDSDQAGVVYKLAED